MVDLSIYVCQNYSIWLYFLHNFQTLISSNNRTLVNELQFNLGRIYKEKHNFVTGGGQSGPYLCASINFFIPLVNLIKIKNIYITN